ncbi:hypothetical protein H4R20_006834, partial [Coemansia guatemalensis]
ITGSLSRTTLGELWFVPVLYVLLGFVGLAWTRYGGQTLQLPDGFRRLCAVAVYFSNVNTILIPIMQEIASSPQSRFLLRDEHDTPQAVADRAIAYGMVIGIVNNVLRWSVGVAIMQPPAVVAGPADDALTDAQADPVRRPLLAPSDDTIDDGFGEVRADKSVAGIVSGIWRVIAPCLTPPLCGVLAAVVVVLAPPIQRGLLEKGTYAHSLWAAVDTCGDGCIPLTLVALGGQLRAPHVPRPAEAASDPDYADVSAADQKRGVALVLTGRFWLCHC